MYIEGTHYDAAIDDAKRVVDEIDRTVAGAASPLRRSTRSAAGGRTGAPSAIASTRRRRSSWQSRAY
jgi:hypothetical protein